MGADPVPMPLARGMTLVRTENPQKRDSRSFEARRGIAASLPLADRGEAPQGLFDRHDDHFRQLQATSPTLASSDASRLYYDRKLKMDDEAAGISRIPWHSAITDVQPNTLRTHGVDQREIIRSFTFLFSRRLFALASIPVSVRRRRHESCSS